MTFDKIIESVPNFSEGRNKNKIERIADVFRNRTGVKLVDYSADVDHNRMVVTAIGQPDAVSKAIIDAVGTAIREIDLNNHFGQHPRIGAVDVIPFIPLKGMTMAEANLIATTTAKTISDKFQLPVYLYEYSASSPLRKNLADVRKGEFEGLKEKMKLPEWQPDYGTATPHPTAGATAVGARKPLIAFNVNLNTDRLDIACNIARKIRASNGGLPCCKALGMELKSKNIVQVSINLTDYTQTSLFQIVEAIKQEAAIYGVSTENCELIGLLPAQAIIDTAASYLDLENFSVNQILENHY